MDKPKFARRKFPTLKQMHEDWEINCLHNNLPRIQYIEMKKAFMAGVASMFQVLKYEIPEISDDKGIEYLNKIDDNLVEYFTKDIFKES